MGREWIFSRSTMMFAFLNWTAPLYLFGRSNYFALSELMGCIIWWVVASGLPTHQRNTAFLLFGAVVPQQIPRVWSKLCSTPSLLVEAAT
jgi:hypothetical protein